MHMYMYVYIYIYIYIEREIYSLFVLCVLTCVNLPLRVLG